MPERLIWLLNTVAAQDNLSDDGTHAPSARRLRTFNTLLLPEDLEIPSDEAFATFQPSKGTSKVYSRFSQGLSFFEGLDSPRSFGSAAFFYASLIFLMLDEVHASMLILLVPERSLKRRLQREARQKPLALASMVCTAVCSRSKNCGPFRTRARV